LLIEIDPLQNRSEEDGLKQLLAHLKSFNTSILLFLSTSFICLPVLLQAMKRTKLLKSFLSIFVGISDVFTLLHTKCQKMVEDHKKCFLYPKINSIYQMIGEITEFPTKEHENEANMMLLIFNNLIETQSDFENYIWSDCSTPIENVRKQHLSLIDVGFLEDTVLQPGEVCEISVKVSDHIFKNALLLAHKDEFQNIDLTLLELRNNMATVRIQNMSYINVDFKNQVKIATFVPHPRSVLCPDDVNFLTSYQLLQAPQKGIIAIKPKSQNLSPNTATDEHCFNKGSQTSMETAEIKLGAFPETSYCIVHVSMRVKENDTNFLILEIMLTDVNSKQTLLHCCFENDTINLRDKICIGGKMMICNSEYGSQLLAIENFENFFRMTKNIFESKLVILIGKNVLSQTDILFKTARDLQMTTCLKNIVGVVDLCWILPPEKQYLSEEPLQEIFAECLGTDSELRNNLQKICIYSIKLINLFCPTLSFELFISQFCIDRQTCNQIHASGNMKKKFILRKNGQDFETSNNQNKNLISDYDVTSEEALSSKADFLAQGNSMISKSKIQSLKILAQKLRMQKNEHCKFSDQNHSNTRTQKSLHQTIAIQSLEQNNVPHYPHQQIHLPKSQYDTSSVIIYDYANLDNSNLQMIPKQTKFKTATEEKNNKLDKILEPYLEMAACDKELSKEHTNTKDMLNNAVDDSNKQRQNTDQACQDYLITNSSSAESSHKKVGLENIQDQNETIVVICAFTWAKRNSVTQYISSLDISVPGYDEYSYTVDSIIPPSHWPDHWTKQFYNLKDNVWIPKDCTRMTPTVKSETDAVQKLSHLFSDMSVRFVSCKIIMVTVLPNHIHYLENVCLRHSIKPLTRYFSGWCDLTSLVYNSTAGDNFVIKSSEENVEKLQELYYHACDQLIPPQASKTQVMHEILKTLSKPSCIETFMTPHMENFLLPKQENNLEVFLHVDTTDIEGETIWLAIGFYTPHNGRSWLAPILPNEENASHFLTLSGFMKCQLSDSKTAAWKYKTKDREKFISCLEKQKALKKMTEILEREYHENNFTGIVFTSLTRSKGGVFHILKALIDYGHNDILYKVKGVGDVTTCFESAKHFNLLQEISNLEELYKTLIISKGKSFTTLTEENARSLSLIAFELMKYLKSVDNGKILFAHPLKSPYTNHLLYTSKEHVFLDNFGEVVITKRFEVKQAEKNQLVDVQLIGCLFSGQKESFELTDHPCSKVKLIRKNVTVTKNAVFKIDICFPPFVQSLPKGYKIAKAKKIKLPTESSKRNSLESKSRDPRLQVKHSTEKSQHVTTCLEDQIETTTLMDINEVLFENTSQYEELSNLKDQSQNETLKDGHSVKDLSEVDDVKIKIKKELEKFDSVPLFPNLRGILVPYVLHFLQMTENVPLIPGEDIVIAMASANITNIKTFITELKLDSCNYDLSYLKGKISHCNPYLEFLLSEHFLFFTKLIQKIVTQNIFENFPTFFYEQEEKYLDSLVTKKDTSAEEIKLKQPNNLTMAPQVITQCETKQIISSETRLICEESQFNELPNDGFTKEQKKSTTMTPILETNETSTLLETNLINKIVSSENDSTTMEEMSNLLPVSGDDGLGQKPKKIKNNLNNENFSEEEKEHKEKSFLEIHMDSLNGPLLKDWLKIDFKQNEIVLGEIISENTVHLQKGQDVQFENEHVLCNLNIEKNDTVLVSLGNENQCCFLFPLQFLESFTDCRYGFVLSHPQKLKTCIGFLLNGHLFKAMVSNENIVRDNSETIPLPIGQVVGLNISLPISESRKVLVDCKATFCISCSSLSGNVIMANNVDCSSWSDIKEFFPDVSLEIALHQKSNTHCNLFTAENSESIHELIQFLKTETTETIEWPLFLSTDVENTFESVVTEFEVKLKLIDSKLLVAGSKFSVQRCIATLHQNIAMRTIEQNVESDCENEEANKRQAREGNKNSMLNEFLQESVQDDGALFEITEIKTHDDNIILQSGMQIAGQNEVLTENICLPKIESKELVIKTTVFNDENAFSLSEGQNTDIRIQDDMQGKGTKQDYIQLTSENDETQSKADDSKKRKITYVTTDHNPTQEESEEIFSGTSTHGVVYASTANQNLHLIFPSDEKQIIQNPMVATETETLKNTEAHFNNESLVKNTIDINDEATKRSTVQGKEFKDEISKNDSVKEVVKRQCQTRNSQPLQNRISFYQDSTEQNLKPKKKSNIQVPELTNGRCQKVSSTQGYSRE
jgi:hypothetical protein